MAAQMKGLSSAAEEHRLAQIRQANLHQCFKDNTGEYKVYRKERAVERAEELKIQMKQAFKMKVGDQKRKNFRDAMKKGLRLTYEKFANLEDGLKEAYQEEILDEQEQVGQKLSQEKAGAQVANVDARLTLKGAQQTGYAWNDEIKAINDTCVEKAKEAGMFKAMEGVYNYDVSKNFEMKELQCLECDEEGGLCHRHHEL